MAASRSLGNSSVRAYWTAAFRRMRPLGLFYLAGVFVFALFRVIFLLHNRGSIRQVTASEFFGCMRVGWYYDTAVIAAMMLPFVLLLMLAPPRLYESRPLRRVISGFAAFGLSGFLWACVSDLFFFDHYADRLNYQALSYPLFRWDVIRMIFDGYPIGWAMALTVLIGYFSYVGFRRFGWPRRLGQADDSMASPIATHLLVGVSILACLGPPRAPHSEISPSYICKDHVVNRASLNCVGTLARAVADVCTDTRIHPEEYGFGSQRAAFDLAGQSLVQPGDVFTPRVDNPLVRVSQPHWRRPTGSPPPNVVIVIMESMSSQYVGSLGGLDPWTPELEALGRQGVMFERFYSVGTRTSRGIFGTLSGICDLPGLPAVQSRRTRGRVLTLAELLRARGYATLFVHGGNLKFNDVKRYLSGHGFETIIDRGDFDEHVERHRDQPFGPPGQATFTTYWSVDDQAVFVRADEMFRRQRQPFFGVVLTLTNHPTYAVPHDIFDYTVRWDQQRRGIAVPAVMSEEERAVRYADWAVGDFFRRARQSPYFENTLFVLVADHCRDQRKAWPVDAANFQIYCAMLGPQRLIGPPGRRVPTVASQTDIAPTVLACMGEPYRHCFFGRDVLRVGPDDGFAMLQQNGSIGLVRGQRMVTISPSEPQPVRQYFQLSGRSQFEIPGGFPPASQPTPAGRPSPASQPDDDRPDMLSETLGLFQSAVQLFESGNYHVEK